MEDIIHLLSFSLKTTQFAYDGTYYQQAFGTAMGLPVSVANMVMKHMEQRALATSPVRPFFWKRYVDDVISAVSGNEAERLSMETWRINSVNAPLNRDDGGLLPDAYLHLVKKKRGGS